MTRSRPREKPDWNDRFAAPNNLGIPSYNAASDIYAKGYVPGLRKKREESQGHRVTRETQMRPGGIRPAKVKS